MLCSWTIIHFITLSIGLPHYCSFNGILSVILLKLSDRTSKQVNEQMNE